MPRITRVDWSPRLQNKKGRAAVNIPGRGMVYLGAPCGSEKAAREYARVVAEWRAGQNPMPPSRRASESSITVDDLVAAYWTALTSGSALEISCSRTTLYKVKSSVDYLSNLYGCTPANDFSAAALRTCRQAMLDDDLARVTINRYAFRIRDCFRWAVEYGMVDPAVYHSLLAVKAIRKGRGGRETKKIRPVDDETVNATLKYVPPAVGAMIRLQRLTGMRPGEVCAMQWADVTCRGCGEQVCMCTCSAKKAASQVWVYQPPKHKLSHLDKSRSICIGPRGKAILREYLTTELERPIFSPQKALSSALLEARRRSKRARGVRDAYDKDSFARAIARACDKAFPPPEHLRPRELPNGKMERKSKFMARLTPAEKAELRAWRRDHHWGPNRLRHARLTEVRKQHDLDAASAIAGHSRISMTEHYAERGLDLAAEIQLATG